MRIITTFLFGLIISLRISASGIGDTESNGTTAPEFLKEFSVYPNPTVGFVTVTLNSIDPNEPLQLTVYNLIHQQMQVESLTPFNGSRQVEVDLSKLPKGIYMIEISNGSESKVKRVSLI